MIKKRVLKIYSFAKKIAENYQNNGVELSDVDVLSEVVAKFTSEYLFTSQTQINRLCETDLSLGKRIFNWIKSKFSSMGSATKEERLLKAFLKNAETLYQSAIRSAISKGAIERAYLDQIDKNKTTAKEENNVQENTQAKQTTQENSAENIDKTNSEKYSVPDSKLINHQFPPYNESHSEANQIATRWAKSDKDEVGDQTLVSFHDKWYLVEKFSDIDSGYLIMEKITMKDYDVILKEIKENGRSGKIFSIQGAFVNYGKFNQSRNSIEGTESSVNSLQTQYSGENSKVLRVDREKSSRGQTDSNGIRDSKSSSSDKQKLSINDDIDELFDDYVSEKQEQTNNNETDEQSSKNETDEQLIDVAVNKVKDTSDMKGQTKDTDAVKYRAKLNQEKVYSKTELDELIDNTINKIPDMRLDSKSQEIAVEHLFEKILAQEK